MRNECQIPEPIEADGLLFIGDPHISSQRPGRRKDKDFAATVLGTLDSAIRVANERRLVPVILGDLYDRPKEDDEALKTRVIRSMRKAWLVPIILVGTHNKRHPVLTDGDTLASNSAAGWATEVTKSGAIPET